MIPKHLLLSALAGGLLIARAHSAVYADQSLFLAATSAPLVTGFEEAISPGDVQYPGTSFTVNQNLTVTAPANLTLWGAGVLTPSAVIDADGFSTSLTLQFAQGAEFLGLNYGTMHNQSPNITIDVYDSISGGTLLYSSGPFAAPYIIDESPNFFGIAGVGNIGRVEISGGHAITVDNIYLSPVPEPSSSTALAIALGFACFVRRRGRSK